MAQSNLIGPLTLTVGQPYKLSLDRDMNRVDVQNDSPYDVWLYFGQVEPTDLDNSNNTWHASVRHGHNQTVPLSATRGASAAERSPNAWGAFDGTVWLLAVDPGGLAVSGTISGRSQVYVRGLYPGDPSPVHSALASQVDLTSQPRIVAVPFALLQHASGFWDPTANPTQTIETLTVPGPLSPGPVFVYLYYASAYPNGTGDVSFNIVLQPQDSGHNNVGGSTQIYTGKVMGNTSSANGFGCEFAPSWPFGTKLTIGGTVAFIAVQLVYLTGVKMQCVFNVGCNIDSTNVTPPAEIGNQGLWKFGSAGAPIY